MTSPLLPPTVVLKDALARDDNQLIAKALTAYKAECQQEIASGSDLAEYSKAEIANMNDLARRLDLDEDYYQPENS